MRPRKIEIVPVLNGYAVFVGCQTVVFNRTEDLIENLQDYLKNPRGIEEKFIRDDRWREPDEKLTPVGEMDVNQAQQEVRVHTGDAPRPAEPTNIGGLLRRHVTEERPAPFTPSDIGQERRR